MDAVTGGAGNDSFNAAIQGAGATGTTVAPGDVLNGGEGVDILSIAVAGALATNTPYTLSAVQTNGIEKVLVSNFDTTTGGTPEENNVIDATLMTGLTTVGLSASSATGDTEFSGVRNIVDVEMYNGSGDLTVGYASGVTTGTQTQNIAVSNVGAGTLTVAGVENLNVSSGLVKSTLTALTASAMKSITVTGSTDLTITAALDFANDTTGVTGAIDGTVNASDFTGKLTITSAADEVSITGGSGDDKINMADTLNGYDKIVGGDGADTLTMDVASLSTQFAQVSGIETVQFNDSGAAAAIDASKLASDVSAITLILKDDATGADNLVSTVSNLTEQSVTLTRADEDADVDGQVDLTITNKTDTATDSVSVNVYAIGTQGDEAADTDGDELGMGILDVANFETVNLGSLKSSSVTSNQMMQLTATSATAVNVTGNAALTIDAVSGSKITSFDASGLDAALTATFSGNKVAVKTGQKSSTINFGTSLDANDSITGGAGTADTVTATFSGATALTSAVTMSDVEVLSLTTSGNNALNLANISGLKTLGVTANTQTITGFDFETTIEATGAATVNVTGADASGTADTLKFRQKLDGDTDNVIQATSGVESLSIEVRDTGATANTAGFDLTKFYGSEVTFTQNALSATNVIVDAAGTTLYKTVDTVNATGLKGAFTAAATNATNAVTFNVQGGGAQTLAGGAKDDTFNIGSTAGVAHVITGNAGTDTTNLTVATGLVDVGSIDTENVNLTVPAAVSVSFSTSFGTGVDNVTVSGGNSLSTIALGAIVTEIKTIDASELLGKVTATVAANALDSTLTITGAASATDTVTTSFTTAATTYSMKSSGVEALVISATPAGTTTVNTATAVGLGAIVVSQGNTATQTFTVAGLTGAETITLQDSDDATAGANEHILVASLADATGSEDTIKFKVGSGTIDAGARLQTADVETVSINADAAADLDLTNLTMTAAGATMTLTVTGDSALTISGLGTDVTTIDAAGMSLGGSVVQTARSTTGTVNYTGSDGADTFIMTNFGDTLVGGAGSDTLDINYAAILGGINVNLASATNQIVSANGSAISGSATGFENVDLSGYTGSFGALITSGSSATTSTTSKITGTLQADQIVLSSGVDTVVISAAPTAGDTVIGWGAGADKLDVSGLTLVGSASAGIDIDDTAASGAKLVAAVSEVGQIADNAAADWSDVLTVINAAITVAADTTAANAATLIAIDNGTDTRIYYFSDDATSNTTVESSEIELIATLTGIADATTVDLYV